MNILKKKVHILLLILTITITSVVGISNVSGEGEMFGGYGTPSTSGHNYGTDSNKQLTYFVPVAYGYRVTIVNDKGVRVNKTHSQDYWSEYYRNSYCGGKVYNITNDGSCKYNGYAAGTYGYHGLYNTVNIKYTDSYGNVKEYGNKETIYWSNAFSKGNTKFRYYEEKNYASMTAINGNYVEKFPTDSKILDGALPEKIIKGTRYDMSGSYIGATFGNGNSGSDSLGQNVGIAVQLQVYLKSKIEKIKSKTASEQDYAPFLDLISGCMNDGSKPTIEEFSDKFLLIEPLIAIKRTDQYIANNQDINYNEILVIGTPKELYAMGFYSSVHAERQPYINWGYDYFSYYNPLVYFDTPPATETEPKATSLAGINICGNGVDAVDSDYMNDVLKFKECGGVFGIILSEVSDGKKCPEKVQEAYKNYNLAEGTEGKIDESEYNKLIDEACDVDDNCYWLKASKYTYEDYAINPATISSCSAPSCHAVVSGKMKDGNEEFSKSISEIVKDIYEIGENNTSGWNSKLEKILKFGVEHHGSKIGKVDLGNKTDGTISNVVILKQFGSSYMDSGDYCDVSVCENVLNKLKTNGKLDENNLNKLYEIFPQYNLLSSEILKNEDGEIDFSVASCKSTPICKVKTITASCQQDKKNEFTISDGINEDGDVVMTSDLFVYLTSGTNETNPTCLNAGFAYTYANDTKLPKIRKSLEKTEYGTPSNPATCWESTEFELPTSVDNIVAGTVFRWGKDGNPTDTSKDFYGKMKVERWCTIEKDGTITSNWANVEETDESVKGWFTNSNLSSDLSGAKINPKIKMYYKEAVLDEYKTMYPMKTYDLGVKLAKISMQTKDAAGNLVDDYNNITYIGDNIIEGVDCNNDENALTCKENGCLTADCSDVEKFYPNNPRQTTPPEGTTLKGGYVHITAEYNIVYKDTLKWYSDSDSAQKVPYQVNDEKIDLSNNNYVYLGYGLPTSFITPSLAGNYYYGYSLDSNNSGGAMFVTIENIGTRDDTDTDEYHFDRLIDYVIDDDSDGSFDSSKKIVYSCGFKINNYLYGNEECKGGACPDTPPCTGICKGIPDHTPKDIDVVFRTINLLGESDTFETAFPGRSGKGRDIGVNWKKRFNYEMQEDQAELILSSDVYSRKEPLYKIKLNSISIQEIRKENKAENAYTSMKNYSFNDFVIPVGKINSSTAGQIMIECAAHGRDDGAGYCSNAQYLLLLSSKIGVMGDKLGSGPIEYKYAASEFLTKLATSAIGSDESTKLTGKCMSDDLGKNTADRAISYSKTLGCN